LMDERMGAPSSDVKPQTLVCLVSLLRMLISFLSRTRSRSIRSALEGHGHGSRS
jgi:hypothetical protein